ncbi:metallophosphoesterase family protein [Stratiformator vulcanicus]|uniref:Phosphoesterase n=1 Tax=Stratiformator vulcanicus TaxID=2527980 RepID=A0A517QXR7_9PLAN|nr:YfcE family phosphodiesterase [Stratiformator vulcanicus]QDT36445.1 phosphodiesterase [Stratiformator vulcanicus]
MKVAVLSDTHGQISNTTEAIRQIERYQPDAVLHCGDIGRPDIVPLFRGRPTHFVFGNVDRDEALFAPMFDGTELIGHGRFADLTLGTVRIAMTHGDDPKLLRKAIRSGDYDLVCHGHTHVRRLETISSTLVLNPGAMHRAAEYSIAIVELPSLNVEFVTVNHN